MKKFLACFLLLCLTLLTGCFNQSADIINNSFYSHNITQGQTNELVGEVYAFNLQVLSLDAESHSNLTKIIVAKLEDIKKELTIEFSLRLGEQSEEIQKKLNGKVALLVSNEQDIISLKINFENKEVWNFFSTSKTYEPQLEKSLFIVRRIDTNTRFGAVTNLTGEETIIGEYIKENVFSNINSEILKDIKYKSSFNYITPTKRRHSSADAIVGYAGLYYHQWDTTNGAPQVKLWYNFANVVSWYILALVLTALIVSLFILINHILEKRKKVETVELTKEDFLKELFEDDEKQ